MLREISGLEVVTTSSTDRGKGNAQRAVKIFIHNWKLVVVIMKIKFALVNLFYIFTLIINQ